MAQQPVLKYSRGFSAYRTTVSIRMSPLLIRPQLAVNCVGAWGRKRDFWISFHSLLPMWLRTGAGFSPAREYNKHLLLSSTAAASYFQLCFRWLWLMRCTFMHPQVVGAHLCALLWPGVISLKAKSLPSVLGSGRRWPSVCVFVR